jgi:hypothetical protein
VDPIKIVIFVVAFVALIVLGRILSASSEVHASSLPQPQPISTDVQDPHASGIAPPDDRQKPAVTGAEFGFPFKVPPVTRREDGTYNRPNFTNYYFSKTDLVRGPEDPGSFLDELCLQAEDPVNGYTWDYHFTITTPSGLRRIMEEEKFASLYFTGGVVVVAQWDLAEILSTVVDEIMKDYGNRHLEQQDANR